MAHVSGNADGRSEGKVSRSYSSGYGYGDSRGHGRGSGNADGSGSGTGASEALIPWFDQEGASYGVGDGNIQGVEDLGEADGAASED